MRQIKLDRIDRRILRDLQADGRMTNVELAQRVGISAPPCLRRVRALEKSGLIRGYHADINPEALGFGVTVFAQVGLSSQSDVDLRAFFQPVDAKYTVIAYVKNVFDTEGYAAAVAGSQRNLPALNAAQNLEITPPRLFGVEVQYRF